MRCFLAMELSDEAREHLSRVQESVRRELPKGSFPRVQNLHVTLKFLGEVGDRQLAALCESMQHIKLSARIELSAAGIDRFPQHGPPRVIVATMSGSEALVAALHQAIEQRCRKPGFDSENRRYHPHVTLARLKGGATSPGPQRLHDSIKAHWPGPLFDLSEFVLFESRQGAAGSEYLKLATFRFVE
jgi:2'-5' RNA ligase